MMVMEAGVRSCGWWLRFLVQQVVGGGSGVVRMKEAAWCDSVWRRRKRQRKRERVGLVVFL
jgi:hypothetical protein